MDLKMYERILCFGLASFLFGLMGCSSEQSVESVAVVSVDIQTLSNLSGVTVDTVSQQRFILDGQNGIFELLPDGSTNQLWSRPESLPQLTDICVIGGGRFIVAADGDGYIVDLATGSANQHFCLDPGWDPSFDTELRHENRAVACDLQNRIIYGQPRTIDLTNDHDSLRSEIAAYSLVSGDDIEWRPLPDAMFQAGGMVLLPNGNLLMGSEDQLSVFNMNENRQTTLNSLTSFGVEKIDGLSYDDVNHVLLVLDDKQQALLQIDVDQLPLLTRHHFKQ